jgi:hypothetical protein
MHEKMYYIVGRLFLMNGCQFLHLLMLKNRYIDVTMTTEQ